MQKVYPHSSKISNRKKSRLKNTSENVFSPSPDQGEKAQFSTLGNHYQITAPPPDSQSLLKWALQSCARKLLPQERVCSCCRVPKEKAAGVDIHHSTKFDSYHFGNLITCGSVWLCPVCAAKITERRRRELNQIIDQAIFRLNAVAMLTLTVPHQYGDSCQVVTDKLLKAKELMQHRKTWKKLMMLYRCFGDIRAFEVTHGINGWHPHFHILLFFDFEKLSLRDRVHIRAVILDCWQKACLSVGLPLPNRHGVTLQTCNKAVAGYIQKFGIDYEMTRGHLKQGRKGGRTPFALLSDYLAGDQLAGSLFREYASVFKGKKQLVFSRGLRKMFGLEDEKTDAELAELQENDATLFATIPFAVWRVVLRSDQRGQLLQICKKGYDAFQDFICNLMMADPYYLTDS